MKRRSPPSEAPAPRKAPIEPLWAITEHLEPVAIQYDDADGFSVSPGEGPDRTEHRLLTCLDCEAYWTGSWTSAGEPIYAGGWRLVRQRDRDGAVTWGEAPCRCAVGEVVRRGNPRVPPVPENYPPNRAMEEARITGADPRKWVDTRDVRPVNDAERAGWMRQAAVLTPDEAGPNESEDDALPF